MIDRYEQGSAHPSREGDHAVVRGAQDGAERSGDVDPAMALTVWTGRRLEGSDHRPGHRPRVGAVRGSEQWGAAPLRLELAVPMATRPNMDREHRGGRHTQDSQICLDGR